MLIYKGNKYIMEVIMLDNRNTRVSGLSITYKIYNSADNALIQDGIMEDRGNGLYQAEFFCDQIGQFRIEYLMPIGWEDKVETLFVVENNNSQVSDIYDMLKRILGLSQENYVLIPIEYNNLLQMTRGRIKIYANAIDCKLEENEQNVYYIEAEYDNEGRLVKYKVLKEQ